MGDSTTAEAPVFRRKVRPAALLKRPRIAEDLANLANDTADDERRALEDVKTSQELRKRGRGMLVEDFKDSDYNDDGLIAKSARVDTMFTQQKDEEEINKHMLRYIEDNLTKKRPKVEPEPDPNAPPSSSVPSEADLYQLPDHLMPKVTPEIKSDIAEPLADSMLVGIIEFDLPIEYKLRNIEETELATQKLAQQSRAKNSASALLQGRFLRPFEQRSSFVQIGDSQMEAATDNDLLDRYKKRFKQNHGR
eukprot:gnl/Spiro4/13419_TR7159_c0_g1_i1.p1 gnl/Spiro4/13419_TR7159_c0_g1~~gnl/Spiro4/13419_TR7159_c0_g1_i1.p1  ORF type:complete len:279 (-),score=53.45 gnl/Spiro4/13419_TR7159_c0_g1_i1:88-837(-)